MDTEIMKVYIQNKPCKIKVRKPVYYDISYINHEEIKTTLMVGYSKQDALFRFRKMMQIPYMNKDISVLKVEKHIDIEKEGS